MPTEFFNLNSLDKFISYIRDAWLVCIIVISELNSNSVDPDQAPHSAASDLDQYCLPVSFLWDDRLIWVKPRFRGSQKTRTWVNLYLSQFVLIDLVNSFSFGQFVLTVRSTRTQFSQRVLTFVISSSYFW